MDTSVHRATAFAVCLLLTCCCNEVTARYGTKSHTQKRRQQGHDDSTIHYTQSSGLVDLTGTYTGRWTRLPRLASSNTAAEMVVAQPGSVWQLLGLSASNLQHRQQEALPQGNSGTLLLRLHADQQGPGQALSSIEGSVALADGSMVFVPLMEQLMLSGFTQLEPKGQQQTLHAVLKADAAVSVLDTTAQSQQTQQQRQQQLQQHHLSDRHRNASAGSPWQSSRQFSSQSLAALGSETAKQHTSGVSASPLSALSIGLWKGREALDNSNKRVDEVSGQECKVRLQLTVSYLSSTGHDSSSDTIMAWSWQSLQWLANRHSQQRQPVAPGQSIQQQQQQQQQWQQRRGAQQQRQQQEEGSEVPPNQQGVAAETLHRGIRLLSTSMQPLLAAEEFTTVAAGALEAAAAAVPLAVASAVTAAAAAGVAENGLSHSEPNVSEALQLASDASRVFRVAEGIQSSEKVTIESAQPNAGTGESKQSISANVSMAMSAAKRCSNTKRSRRAGCHSASGSKPGSKHVAKQQQQQQQTADSATPPSFIDRLILPCTHPQQQHQPHCRYQQQLYGNTGQRWVLQGLLLSDNCNSSWALTVVQLPTGRLQQQAMYYALLALLVCLGQVIMLRRQAAALTTSAALLKVSVVGICAGAQLDACLSIAHLAAAMSMPDVNMPLLVVAAAQFALFAGADMALLLHVWRAHSRRYRQQHHQRWQQQQQPWWQLQRQERDHESSGTSAQSSSLITVRQNIAAALVQLAAARSVPLLYFRFYFVLCTGCLASWLLSSQLPLLLLAAYSLWIPQIHHNITQTAKQPLQPSFIVVNSVARLLLPMYLLTCPDNLVLLPPRPWLAAALAGWVGLQVGWLLLQHCAHPHVLLPAAWIPIKYNYHRVDLPWQFKSSLTPKLRSSSRSSSGGCSSCQTVAAGGKDVPTQSCSCKPAACPASSSCTGHTARNSRCMWLSNTCLPQQLDTMGAQEHDLDLAHSFLASTASRRTSQHVRQAVTGSLPMQHSASNQQAAVTPLSAAGAVAGPSCCDMSVASCSCHASASTATYNGFQESAFVETVKMQGSAGTSLSAAALEASSRPRVTSDPCHPHTLGPPVGHSGTQHHQQCLPMQQEPLGTTSLMQPYQQTSRYRSGLLSSHWAGPRSSSKYNQLDHRLGQYPEWVVSGDAASSTVMCPANQTQMPAVGASSSLCCQTGVAGTHQISNCNVSPNWVEDVNECYDAISGQGTIECLICMDGVALLPAHERLLTPCGHFFHPECLASWMDVKAECPTCRGPLPPL